MWERYCLGVSSIIWVVDSADPSTFPVARNELFSLLEKSGLKGIPLLVRSLRYLAWQVARLMQEVQQVLANKSDLEERASINEVIKALGLQDIVNREVSCYAVSAKNQRNLDITLSWLMKRGK
jgi:ADP-ribosylation factor-like protein 8